MKTLRKPLTGIGITLIAGAAIAVGGASPALAAAGRTLFEPTFPVVAFTPAVGAPSIPVGAHSIPVGAHSVPVGAYSVPRCVDVRTPRAHVSVGSASSPQPCLTIRTGGATGGPVGTASLPHTCIVVQTPRATVRTC